MHLRHLHLVDLRAVDVELAAAAGDALLRSAGLHEVELDRRLTLRQRLRFQRVVEPVVVVVVVVGLAALDEERVAAGEAAAGNDHPLLPAAQVEGGLDAVGAPLDRGRGLLGDAPGAGRVVDELLPVAEEPVLLLGEPMIMSS